MSMNIEKRDETYTQNSRHLIRMGWRSRFQKQLKGVGNEESIPARVVDVSKNRFRVSTGEREWLATLAGRLKRHPGGVYPVTGDWVLLTGTVISRVLARENALSRGAAGTRHKKEAQPNREQVLAANLDTVLVVCGLDRDYNLRRIERYLALVYNCGLTPVIVLTKADLHQDPAHFVTEVETVAFGVPVHLISALDGNGLGHLETYLRPGQTAAMVGSSGAGKSTLVNRLYGDTVQATASISDRVGKGMHTTTNRELIVMPQGGMVIDNPGIREIAFWSDDGGIDVAFPDIEARAGACRFSDCTHRHEPGCRVLRAVAEGAVPQDRLESYHKMKREVEYLAHRQHKSADRVEKERWKGVALKIKAMKKGRRNG
jgi:ribosome biogenesis GTPase